jgi:O-antigen/teichoic acid export membrane protein
VFTFRLVICALLIVLIGIAGYCIPGTLGILLILYAVSFVPQIFYTVNLYYGVEWSWPVMLYFIGGRIVYVLLLFLYVKNPGDSTAVPLAFGAAILVENAFLLILWIKRMGSVLFGIRVKMQLSRWKPVVPVTCSGAFVLLHENAAIVILYIFLGSAAAGIYSASYRLVYIAISLATLLSYVFLARLTKARQEHSRHAFHLFRFACITAVFAGLCAGIAGTVLAEPVIRLIYVDAFLPSAGLLVLAVWQMVLAPIRILAFQTVNACHQQNRALPYIAAGSLGSVIVIVIGIWQWGMKGAVIGTIAGEAILTLLLFLRALISLKAAR